MSILSQEDSKLKVFDVEVSNVTESQKQTLREIIPNEVYPSAVMRMRGYIDAQQRSKDALWGLING